MRRGLATLFALGVLLSGVVLARAAGSPSPPFKQCPAIGLDTGCALLIQIANDGSVAVYGDPAQGPFDGVEDTLIGVQNNSGLSITSIPVSATTGKPLFGFDEDGLCSGVQSGGSGVFAAPPAGCSFGSTGYEGPGVSFSDISADTTSGKVNFSPAIPPGGRAYFSLEEALATIPPFDISPGPPSTGAVEISDSANEPVVAVNPADPMNIVVAYNHVTAPGKVDCGYSVSHDAGVQWKTYDFAAPSVQGVSASWGDPALAFTPNGTLYLACLAGFDDGSFQSQAVAAIYTAVSNDEGDSFSSPQLVIRGSKSGNKNCDQTNSCTEVVAPDQERLAAAPDG